MWTRTSSYNGVKTINRNIFKRPTRRSAQLQEAGKHFPAIKALLSMTGQGRETDFYERTWRIRLFVDFQFVELRRRLYSKEYRKMFWAGHSKAIVGRDLREKGKYLLLLDGVPIPEGAKWNTGREKWGVNCAWEKKAVPNGDWGGITYKIQEFGK